MVVSICVKKSSVMLFENGKMNGLGIVVAAKPLRNGAKQSGAMKPKGGTTDSPVFDWLPEAGWQKSPQKKMENKK
ncbi:MAG: hypothetical protein SOT81_01815 [Treponema sp.]|nr:hypothetical protein [Treponema sp.]